MFMHHELGSGFSLPCSPETQHDLSPAIHHRSGPHTNEHAAVSARQADQLPLSLQGGGPVLLEDLTSPQKRGQRASAGWTAAVSDLWVVPVLPFPASDHAGSAETHSYGFRH